MIACLLSSWSWYQSTLHVVAERKISLLAAHNFDFKNYVPGQPASFRPITLNNVGMPPTPRPFEPLSTLLLAGVNIIAVRASDVSFQEEFSKDYGWKYLKDLLLQVPNAIEGLSLSLSVATSTQKAQPFFDILGQNPRIKYLFFRRGDSPWWSDYRFTISRIMEELETNRTVEIVAFSFPNLENVITLLRKNKKIKVISHDIDTGLNPEVDEFRGTRLIFVDNEEQVYEHFPHFM